MDGRLMKDGWMEDGWIKDIRMDQIFDCYTHFFFRKKGYINLVPKSVCSPSVCASVTFLVNVSPTKLLDVATSNFVPR